MSRCLICVYGFEEQFILDYKATQTKTSDHTLVKFEERLQLIHHIYKLISYIWIW